MTGHLVDKKDIKIAKLFIKELRGNLVLGTILSHQFSKQILAIFAEFQEMVDGNSLSHIDAQEKLITDLGYRISADFLEGTKAISNLQIYVYDEMIFSCHVEN